MDVGVMRECLDATLIDGHIFVSLNFHASTWAWWQPVHVSAMLRGGRSHGMLRRGATPANEARAPRDEVKLGSVIGCGM